MLSTGLAEAGAALATVLVMARTRTVLLTMIVGVSVVWGLRVLQAHRREAKSAALVSWVGGGFS